MLRAKYVLYPVSPSSLPRKDGKKCKIRGSFERNLHGHFTSSHSTLFLRAGERNWRPFSQTERNMRRNRRDLFSGPCSFEHKEPPRTAGRFREEHAKLHCSREYQRRLQRIDRQSRENNLGGIFSQWQVNSTGTLIGFNSDASEPMDRYD